MPDFPDILVALYREKRITKRETSPENRLGRRFGHVCRVRHGSSQSLTPGRPSSGNRLGNIGGLKVPANDEKDDPQRHEHASRYAGLRRCHGGVIREGLMSGHHQRDYADCRTRLRVSTVDLAMIAIAIV